jgi:DSBA-like thioredoxin domain
METTTQAGARFAITFDYRCPFARNLHEQVVAGLEAGASWDVAFWPFSLNQVHVGEGDLDVWDDPARSPDLLALLAGVSVRDLVPDRFLTVHRSLFEARHDRGLDLREDRVVRDALEQSRVDAGAVFEDIAGGNPLKKLRAEHEHAVVEHGVFGVPTIVAGDRAVFVRIMDRAAHGRAAIDSVARLLALVTEWPELNELKHTTIPR